MKLKNWRKLFVALFLPLILQCGGNKPTTPSTGQLNQPFTLEAGQALVVGSDAVEVLFERVISDDRCPLAGECHNGDMAVVSVRLALHNSQPIFLLVGITSDPFPELIEALAVDTLGYRVRLNALSKSEGNQAARAEFELSKSSISGDSRVDSVWIADQPSERLNRLQIEIREAAIAQDTLSVNVAYVGGCGIHLIRANSSPTGFSDGEIPAADIYFTHFSGNEPCSTIVIRDLKFLLAPIRQAVTDRYGSIRPIQLRLLNYAGQDALDSHKVYYLASPEWLNSAPEISVPDSLFTVAGDTLEWPVSASDPDLTIPTLSAVQLPQRAEFSDLGNGRGLFTYSPDSTDVGDHVVDFIASDGIETDTHGVTVRVVAMNWPPVIAVVDSAEVFEGDSLFLPVRAVDPEGLVTRIAAANLPTNSELEDHGDGTATFAFRPDYDQAGEYRIDLECSDNYTAVAGSFRVRVFNSNRAPRVSAPDSAEAWFGISTSFDVSASDADQDSLVLSCLDFPNNASFETDGSHYGKFTISADSLRSGDIPIRFVASDGELADTAVTVLHVEEAPAVKFIDPGQQELTEGDTLRVVLATRFYHELPTIRFAGDLPRYRGRIQLDSRRDGSSLFTFVPNYMESGLDTFLFVASDRSGVDSLNLLVSVLDAPNQTPDLSRSLGYSPGYVSVAVGQTLKLTISATDPDGSGPPHLTAVGAAIVPTGSGTATFTWRPTAADTGNYFIRLEAHDYLDPSLFSSFDLNLNVAAFQSNSGPLIPLELGTYWVYARRYTHYCSMPNNSVKLAVRPTGYTSIDSTEVVDSVRVNGRLKWILSPSESPLGPAIFVQGDSLDIAGLNSFIFPAPAAESQMRYGRCGPTTALVPTGAYLTAYYYRWHPYGSGHYENYVEAVPGVGVVRCVVKFGPDDSPMSCESGFCCTGITEFVLIRKGHR